MGKGKLRQLPCGHYVFAKKKHLERAVCGVCPELDHLESINKAINLRVNPRGFKKEGK